MVIFCRDPRLVYFSIAPQIDGGRCAGSRVSVGWVRRIRRWSWWLILPTVRIGYFDFGFIAIFFLTHPLAPVLNFECFSSVLRFSSNLLNRYGIELIRIRIDSRIINDDNLNILLQFHQN